MIFFNDVPVSVSTSGTLAFSCAEGEIDVVSETESLAARYDPPVSDGGIRYNVLEPVWSPDGTRLAFMRARSDSATGYFLDSIAVMVMAADGDSAATIVSVAAAGLLGGGYDGPNNASLCWMPNGGRIVFNVPEDTYVLHLWVVKADGTALTKLTTASGAYDRSVSCGR